MTVEGSPDQSSDFDWNDEQQAVLLHDVSRHGLVLAGPGTGKSTVVIAFADLVAREIGPESVRLATFTRAATAELADEFFERRVATPFGELKAIAIAAGVLATQNPELDFDEVEVTEVEHEFGSIWSADLRDRKAIAR